MATTISGSTATSSSERYATVAQLKTRLGISDTTDDTALGMMIDGICRAIDEHCGRRFYTTTSTETRYFTAEFSDVLQAGDIVSITTLYTDDDGDRTYENTWAATDYDLEPFNAALDGKPYTEIAVTPDGVYSFPTVSKGVKIVGKWGWSTTPYAITEAVLLLSEKLFKRRDAIFGVVSSPLGELKQMIKDDPEINLLLQPYVKFDINGV